MSRVQYLIGDVRARLADLPDGSVDLVVTSWPYWLQRAYLPDDHPNKPDEIGQEPTVAGFVATLLEITAEIGRVLAPHGSIAMELADTYSGSGGAGGDYADGGFRDGQPTWKGSAAKSRHSIDNPSRASAHPRLVAKRVPEYGWGLFYAGTTDKAVGDHNGPWWPSRKLALQARSGIVQEELPDKSGRGLTGDNRMRDRASDEAAGIVPHRDRRKHDGRVGVIPPDKSLCMIPELFRVALAYGINPLTGDESPAGMWRCRNVVLHCRPNPSVGADGDKFRPGKSDWIMATRDRARYWDPLAVRVPASPNTNARTAKGAGGKAKSQRKGFADEDHCHSMVELETTGDTSPLLDHWWDDDPRLDRFDQEAWHLATAPYKGAHYATFSPKLIAPMILAMCPERVCTLCGQPARRVVDRVSTGQTTLKSRAHTDDARQVHAVSSTDVPDHSTVAHVGWDECGCEGDDRWRRGVVLDPFGGSGTTGMVASSNGRDAILIDFDDRNIDLARARCGMFLEVDSPEDVA